jgi:aarF domain-containing kinase
MDDSNLTLQATQLRVQFVKDEAERERIWEEQHERAADRVHALCCDLKGFFLKVCHARIKLDVGAEGSWIILMQFVCF